MNQKEQQLKGFQELKPFLRTAAAFIMRLRFGGAQVGYCYETVDQFLKIIEEDLK